jgi:translation initiation factor 3 subunit D
MNLNLENGFGILRAIVDLCGKLPSNGDFILMRDPNKPLLLIYQISNSSDVLEEDFIDCLVPVTAKLHISDVGSGSE